MVQPAKRSNYTSWARAILLLAAILLAPCCVLLPTWVGPPAAPGGLRGPFEDGYQDFKGVIHCHSQYSHDSEGSPEEIIRAARRTGMQFLIMTDHPSPQAISLGLKGWYEGILFLVGVELSQGGKRSPRGDWSILALDIHESIEQDQPTQPLIAEIQRQGGLAFVGHIESVKRWDFVGYDGLEVYNVHADLDEESRFLLALRGLFLPPHLFFSTNVDRPSGNLARWDELTRKSKVVAIAGNDAHANVKLLKVAGTVGTYEQMFKIVSTHILAPRLDRESLKDALRKGHAYISMDLFGDGTGFTFRAQDGSRQAIMGDEIVWSSGLRLQVYSPGQGRIKLFQSGQLVHQVDGQRLDYPVPGPGVYRVEVDRKGRFWLCSNPIYVKDGSPEHG